MNPECTFGGSTCFFYHIKVPLAASDAQSMPEYVKQHPVAMQHIWSLENEREARGQEATEAQQRHAQALQEVKLRDMAAADLQKKVNYLVAVLFVMFDLEVTFLFPRALNLNKVGCCSSTWVSCSSCMLLTAMSRAHR